METWQCGGSRVDVIFLDSIWQLQMVFIDYERHMQIVLPIAICIWHHIVYSIVHILYIQAIYRYIFRKATLCAHTENCDWERIERNAAKTYQDDCWMNFNILPPLSRSQQHRADSQHGAIYNWPTCVGGRIAFWPNSLHRRDTLCPRRLGGHCARRTKWWVTAQTISSIQFIIEH